MILTIACVALALAALGWYVTTTLLIYEFLRKRKVTVSFILLRLLAFSYVAQYKEITVKETGTTGPLFYHWVVSINVALAAILVMLIARL